MAAGRAGDRMEERQSPVRRDYSNAREEARDGDRIRDSPSSSRRRGMRDGARRPPGRVGGGLGVDRTQRDGRQAAGRRAGQGTHLVPLRRPVAAAPRLRRGERAPAEPGAAAGCVQAPARRVDRARTSAGPTRARRSPGRSPRAPRRTARTGGCRRGSGCSRTTAFRRRATAPPGSCAYHTGPAGSRCSRSGPTGPTAASTTSTGA